MHQPVSQNLFYEDYETNAILYAIDFEDVALSLEGVHSVHHGAQAVMRQFMPAANDENLTVAQAISLFVDRVFWEENSGNLFMCAEIAKRNICLPIPREHWHVQGIPDIPQ